MCVPCISPILSGLGVLGAGAAATAGAMTMTSSKLIQSGNNIEREQSFEKNTSKTHKKGKKSKKESDKLKFYISQKNNKDIKLRLVWANEEISIHDLGKYGVSNSYSLIQRLKNHLDPSGLFFCSYYDLDME